jgi:hypothetical protein
VSLLSVSRLLNLYTGNPVPKNVYIGAAEGRLAPLLGRDGKE